MAIAELSNVSCIIYDTLQGGYFEL